MRLAVSLSVPLPDFFIGAHAQLMGWVIATAAAKRFRTYFPGVRLWMPGERIEKGRRNEP
jgi:hypothetical protein